MFIYEYFETIFELICSGFLLLDKNILASTGNV